MASTTQKIIPMTRFSISEDEEEAPIIFKRARLSELASQWQGSVLPSQSRAAVEEDVEDEDFLPIDDVESDSQAPGETEDDEESDTEEDDDASDHGEAEPVPAGQNQQEQRAPTASTVVNKGNGELQVVLTDPDVFDCPICFEPLCTPVFQKENVPLAACRLVITVAELLKRSSNQSKFHAKMLAMVAQKLWLTVKKASMNKRVPMPHAFALTHHVPTVALPKTCTSILASNMQLPQPVSPTTPRSLLL
ncbi:hypothetical protein E3N88_20423 [Mikania micrantha]|uniref:Uncharacterized protein n=1 Tax=Mikania micrantha TaxID=192012 RepID=A0A5N6NIN0_9ASTR|nr:hypothetical protein E3N88_20423 [Mikania micrantha]